MMQFKPSKTPPDTIIKHPAGNNMLNNLIMHDHLASIQLDTDLKITFWDTNAEDMFGYSQEEAVGLFLTDLVNDEDKKNTHFNYLFNILSKPENKSDSASNRTKNGEEVLCEWFYSPVLDGGNKICGISVIVKNITDWVNLEKELKISQKHNLKDIFEKAPIGIYQVDMEGRFVNVNPELAWMLGYETSESLTKGVTDFASQLFHDEDSSNDFFFTLFEADQLNHFKSRIKRKDGSTFWALSNAQITKDEEGRKNGFSGFLLDISSTVRVEKALKESKEVAEEATRVKSEFLANMSHEIRTPLNAIINFSNLVLETELNKRQHEYVQKAAIAGRTLLGIVNDILDFSKIEAGKLELEQSQFLIHELLNNIIDMFSSKVAEQGIELIVSVSPDVPEMLIGDSLRLGQVLINLINNSIKFTESGEVVVWVSQVKKSEKKITLQFLVSDTGLGMTPDQQSKLFTSFSQADTSTTRKYGGTGLGLTISKKIVELMEGKIWVKSQDKEGSVFACTAKLGFQPQYKKHQTVPDNFTGKRVLIQNENAAFRDIFLMILMYFSFEVHVVSSTEELVDALEIASEDTTPFDLLIMSKINDESDYLKRIEAFTNKESIKNIPVIMTADFGQDEITESNLNIAGVLVKPVKQTELVNTLMGVFHHKPVYETLPIENSDEENDELIKLKGAKILLVEDNEINQEIAEAILTKKGIITDIANNGLEAVEMVRTQGYEKQGKAIVMPYDAILMDIQMPEMDGYEASELIREWEKGLTLSDSAGFIPIIAMSAHAVSPELEKSRSVGMNAYLSKPIDKKALFSELIKWISPVQRNDTCALKKTDAEDISGVFSGFPETLEGFSLDSGLEKLSNNKGLYKKLLIKFYKKNLNTARDIKKLLTNDKKEDASRLAHTIKGVAGNLGAERLCEKAGVLEAFINNRYPETPADELAEFSKEIEIVLTAIRPFASTLPPENPTTDEQLPEHYDFDEPAKRIAKIINLIEDDIEATRINLEELQKELSSSVYNDIFKLINTHIEDYEIDRVIDELTKLGTSLSKSPVTKINPEKSVNKDQKILIVDDASENIEILVELLKSDYKIVAAKNGERAIKTANSLNPPDLILLDVNMPGMDGYTVCERLKSSEQTKDIPIIFITAASEVTDQTKGFKIGAVDYITKPIVPVIVKMRVETQLKIKKQQDLLENLAIIDGLTQIPNRRRFDDIFEAEWKRGQRDGKPLSLILMDIDHFKQFNDNYGHQAGDDCLIKVAEALRSTCKRKTDLVARYGGEEFVAVLPNTDTAAAFELAESMRAELEKMNIKHQFSSAADHVTISQGIVSIVPSDRVTMKQVIELSDHGLYEAKESGRNRAVVRSLN